MDRKIIFSLLLCFAVMHTNEAGTKDPPSGMKILSEWIGDISPCAAPCLLKDFQTTITTLSPCVTQMTTDIIEFFSKEKITEYKDFYYKVISTPPGREESALCTFYDRSAGCLSEAFGNLCGKGFASRFDKVISDTRTYANCDTTYLPYLRCAAHPDIVPPVSSADSYVKCVEQLVTEVNKKYLDENGNFFWENFFRDAIKKNGGKGVQDLIKPFGTCLDDTITGVSDCQELTGKIAKGVQVIMTFFDYTNPNDGTDALLCFADTNLWTTYTDCYNRMVQDFVFAIQINIGLTKVGELRRQLMNLSKFNTSLELWQQFSNIGINITKEKWQEILLLSRNFELNLDTCLRMGTERICGYKWSTKAIHRDLEPIEDFFTNLVPEVHGPDCQKTVGPVSSAHFMSPSHVCVYSIASLVAMVINAMV